MNTISVKECLNIIDSGASFSFKCVTYDRQKKTGGEIMDYSEAVVMQRPKEDEVIEQVGRPLTGEETLTLKRSQNHWTNFTRNVRILQGGMETAIKKKIHPPLLIEFNGIKVTP